MSRSDTALRFEDVTFTYPDTSDPALSDVSLEIAAGTFALVTGATGAGKSTLLRCANGLVPHFTGGTFGGRVFVDGRDTLAAAPRDLADVVAFVPQDPAASFVLDRVEDELAYGMENLAVPAQQMRRRVEETLDLLTLDGLRNRSVRTLSGGERQRVAIGAALAAGPRILVLDEPTSQLDPQGAEDVLAALQRLVHDHGMTVLIAEHRLERVAGFVDLAIACEDGVVTTGDPAAVISRLQNGPPVTRLGAMLGWSPPPLTVRDARTIAGTSKPPDLEAAGDGSSSVSGGELLTVRDLSAGYDYGGGGGGGGDSRKQKSVLAGLDFSVSAGEVIAVMGRNGAGKTTLLRCLAGVHEPSGGSVTAHRSGRAPEPGIDTALCPQEPENVLFKDTVELEVRATLEARKANAGTREADSADTVLQALAIGDLAERHPHDLSAGQRMLVATAAIVATGAPVLLLDEPTRGLDPEAKHRLAAFLRNHAGGGADSAGAAVFATHDVELAADLATRVVMLAGGDIIADGKPAEVLGDSHVFAPQMTRVFGPGWLTPDQVAKAMAAV